MKKFEYKKYWLMDNNFESIQNQFGAEGWEIIGVNIPGKSCYMKREIPIEYEYKSSRDLEEMVEEGWEPIGITKENVTRSFAKIEVEVYLFRKPKQ